MSQFQLNLRPKRWSKDCAYVIEIVQEEKEILAMIRDGDRREAGFRRLIQTYQNPLYLHIRRMVTWHEDANDVMQNTFIKIYKGIASFKGQSSLYTWVYSIATNECLTFLKKRSRHEHIPLDNLAFRLQEDPYFDGDQVQIELVKAINQLPAKQRQVFILRYYEEMSYDRMSDILSTSVGALKANYHHAVKKIASFMKTKITEQ